MQLPPLHPLLMLTVPPASIPFLNATQRHAINSSHSTRNKTGRSMLKKASKETFQLLTHSVVF